MASPALAELRRAPALADQIYLRVRFQLRAGTFAPGERLVETALAQELAVSRSPVREALSRLTADGLLESGGNGFQVAMPTRQDMAEIFDMRRLLEPTAARRVARTADGALTAALFRAFLRTRTAHADGDFPEFLSANYDFRAAWVERVPNQRLAGSILRFDDQAGFVRRTTLVHSHARDEVLALLERYLDAFERQDEDAAAEVTEAFIEGAERHYRDVRDQPD